MGQQALLDANPVWVTPDEGVTCASCGVLFWMTSQLHDRRRQDHKDFYCPNGHVLVFHGETEAEKYKRLYKSAEDRAAAARAERDQAEASRRAWKGQATRARNAALAGTCPLCGQSLRDLKRHMERQHKDASGDVE